MIDRQYGITGYGVSRPGYKVRNIFVFKNQHTQRKLLNFENWTNVASVACKNQSL